MDLNGKIINFLGDSITYGVRTQHPEEARFSTLMQKIYGLKRANNYGIGGSAIADTRAEISYWYRCDKMDPEADINVILGGTNDFGDGEVPLGQFSDRTPDTFYGACHYMMRKTIETYPKAVTVICTPLHRIDEDDPRGEGKPEPVAPLSTYVAIIREVAEYYSLPVLDLWRMSGLQPKVDIIRQLYMPDGVHPYEEGQKILAARIGGFLAAL